MLNVKYRFENILFYDTDSIANRLEQMAAEGWMIEKITANLYKYRKTEPRKVKFAVTYFPKNTAYELYPSDKQQSYLELCEEAGWQPVLLHNQLQVLMNEDENAVAIETDRMTRLDNIHSTAKKTFIAFSLSAILCSFMLGLSLVMQFIANPLQFITDGINIPAICICIFFGVKDIYYLSKYILWHRQSVQNMELMAVKENKKIRLATTLTGLWLVLWCVFRLLSIQYRKLFLCIIALMLLAGFISQSIKRRHIENGKEPWDVRFASLLAGVVIFGFGYYGVLTMDTSDTSHLTDEQTAYIEEMYGDMGVSSFVHFIWYPASYEDTESRFSHIFPLEMGDYNPYLDERGQFFYRESKNSIIPYTEAKQTTGSYTMQYSIYNTEKLPDWFAEYVVKRTVTANIFIANKYPEVKSTFKQTDSSLWKADKVYTQLDSQGYKTGVYMVCHENRIVLIRFESPNILTDDGIKIISEKLGM